MKCPKCNEDMKFVSKGQSFNSENKAYDKNTYKCTDDDVWIVVEAPGLENNS